MAIKLKYDPQGESDPLPDDLRLCWSEVISTPEELLALGGRPAKSGKRYTSKKQVRAVANYINRFGIQSGRYYWRVARHADETFELWTFPNSREVQDALDEAVRQMHLAHSEIVEAMPFTPEQEEELRRLLNEARAASEELLAVLREKESALPTR
jgi:hypothetical protein